MAVCVHSCMQALEGEQGRDVRTHNPPGIFPAVCMNID